MYEIDHLDFNTDYIFNITGMNTKHRIEGKTTSYPLRTPTCWHYHGYQSNYCREYSSFLVSHLGDFETEAVFFTIFFILQHLRHFKKLHRHIRYCDQMFITSMLHGTSQFTHRSFTLLN